MRTLIFDNIETLNKYLVEQKRHTKNTDVQFKSFVVGERKTTDGKVWDIIDRFLVVEQ